jgi:Na+-driven multidrug efflux pump
MAKTSAHKSMLFSVIVSLVISAIYVCLSDKLPGWLTSDETIQGMLAELIPLIALGNITLTVGMGKCSEIIMSNDLRQLIPHIVSFNNQSVLGYHWITSKVCNTACHFISPNCLFVADLAMSSCIRYKLATSISLATSLLITIPLGLVMTLWHINLQGLVFSILMGYIACAWIMLIVIRVSDWDALSKDIVERVAKGDLDIECCSTDSSDVSDKTDLSADYIGEEIERITGIEIELK